MPPFGDPKFKIRLAVIVRAPGSTPEELFVARPGFDRNWKRVKIHSRSPGARDATRTKEVPERSCSDNEASRATVMYSMRLMMASILVCLQLAVTAVAPGDEGPKSERPGSPPTTGPAGPAAPRTLFGETPEETRKTSDGIALPIVAAEKVRLQLPIIGGALGATPEEVCGGFESLVQRQSSARIQSLFPHRNLDQTARLGPDALVSPADAIWVFGPFRAAAVTMRLNHGRVTRLALHYPSLTPGDLRSLVGKLQPYVGGKEIDISRGANSHRKGTRVTLAGTRSAKLPIPVHCTINWFEPRDPNAPRDTCVVFEVDPVEWHLLYNPVDDDTATAMRAGKPVPGMTREQVILSVGQLPWRELPWPEGKGTVINWHAYSVYWKEERVVARARFDAEGKLAEFKTWSVDAKDAPKVQ